MPATPTCGPTPPTHDGFVDVVTYSMDHDFEDQPMHGLPLVSRQKETAAVESLYESFLLVQSPTDVQSLPIDHSMAYPSPSNYDPSFPVQLNHQSMHMTNTSLAASEWDGFSTVAWSDSGQQSYHYLDHSARRISQLDHVPMGELQAAWHSATAQSLEQVHPMPSETIIPSDAMVEDYVLATSDGLENVDAVGGVEPSFPQAPQEVSFKKEESPVIKTEVESDTETRRPREGRMFVTSTGAKGVKKERQTRCAAKKKPKIPKHRTFKIPLGENNIVVSCDYDVDEYGPYRRCAEGSRKLRCPHILPDGRQCLKGFQRPEHLKRHQKTHTGIVEARCRICEKAFGRNDNCIAHYDTHITKPGKKEGRNKKFTLEQVEDKVEDPKIIEKLRQKFASQKGRALANL